MKSVRVICALIAALALACAAQAQPFNTVPRSSGAAGVATSITTPCSTANAVLYNASTPCSANMTFDSSLILFTVGSGSGTATGITIGYSASSGLSGVWPTNATKTTSGYGIIFTANGTAMYHQTNDWNVVADNGGNLKIRQQNTAGLGPAITAGTAITDVAALSITRTNNNAAVATGVKWTFTDTSSAAGFLPFQILGGSGSTTNLFSVPKEGGFSVLSKVMSGTAPTYASGGCLTGAGTVVTNSNGTAYITVTNGTGCSGSQPIVLTFPAATTGWRCDARNVSNAASSSPAQTGAVSTTSVTITNFVRTTGVAGAWTDGDVVVIGPCMGG